MLWKSGARAPRVCELSVLEKGCEFSSFGPIRGLLVTRSPIVTNARSVRPQPRARVVGVLAAVRSGVVTQGGDGTAATRSSETQE
jgi:hypothetical protein